MQWCLKFVLCSSVLAFCISLLMASKMFSTALRVVYVTVPNKEVASTIARSVVQKKLAACVNIVPGIKSVYEWEGKLNEDEELLLIIKTQQDQIQNLETEVKHLHPYDVPEFIALPVEHASEQYGKWVLEQTKSSTENSS